MDGLLVKDAGQDNRWMDGQEDNNQVLVFQAQPLGNNQNTEMNSTGVGGSYCDRLSIR